MTVFGSTALSDSISVYIEPSSRVSKSTIFFCASSQWGLQYVGFVKF